jgi:LPS O-antigen subunit length determinant protein (WzzB/FepE family)
MSKMQSIEEGNNINFIKLFNFIVKYFWFFAASFIFSFILGTTYKSFTQDVKQYSSKILVLSPSDKVNTQLTNLKDMIRSNPIELLDAKHIYGNFVNNALSPIFQKSVFDKENLESQLNPNKVLTGDNLSSFNSFISSLKLSPNKVGNPSLKKLIDYKNPIMFSINGPKPKVQERFLNSLIAQANQMTIDEYINNTRLGIYNRINKLEQQKLFLISNTNLERLSEIQKLEQQKLFLISNTNLERLSEIQKIKVFDNEKINELLDEIQRINLKEDKLKENRIVAIKEALFMAKKLGIVKNNFNETLNSPNLSNLIVIDSKDYPTWYLFGSDALELELEILSSSERIKKIEVINLENEIRLIRSNRKLETLLARESDELYTPGAIELKNEILALVARESDELYTPGAIELKNEILALEKLSVTLNLDKNISAMQRYKPATSSVVRESLLYKKYFALFAALGGFLLSVLFALILNIFAIVKKSK